MKVGLLGGAEVGVKVAEPFDVTAGLLFMMQGTKAKDNEVLKDYSVTLTYLNVPIMANVYVLPGLALKAGVQPGFLLTSKAKASQNINGSWQKREDTSKDGLNKVDFSIPMGISYEFSNFIIDARYNRKTIRKASLPQGRRLLLCGDFSCLASCHHSVPALSSLMFNLQYPNPI